jgi:glycosyltransferase involved in cell wall biosynthesis
MKKIIINCSDCFAAYNFRLALIKTLQKKYEVIVIAAFDKFAPLLMNEGIKVYPLENFVTSKKLADNYRQYKFYKRIFCQEKPDLIINYTIKPHLLGVLAAPKRTKIINFVSGVGEVFMEENFLFKLCSCFYRLTSKRVDYYIFLNEDDLRLFKSLRIIRQPYSILPSEGVDLDKFYPEVDHSKDPTFIFVGRLIAEKGIREYLEAAKIIKRKDPRIQFLVAGDYYQKKSKIDKKEIEYYQKKGIINFLGFCYNINEVLRDVHVLVLPSYREGMPISLIEALASKKVIIASDVPGCRDILIDNYNGFLVSPQSSYDLMLKMEKYLKCDNKEEMHENALLSSKQYDQNIVVDKILKIILELI